MRSTLMKQKRRNVAFFVCSLFLFLQTQQVAFGQLATCKQKYLGNIVGSYVPDHYTQYWNAVTAENGCKWGSIERTKGQYNWIDADKSYNLALENDYEFRYHAIAWGSQYPSWFPGLSQTESRERIDAYMAAIAARYSKIDQIDVLNENVRTHAEGTPYFRDQLGGAGSTGYDWIVWLFERARFHFPNSRLVINDYGLVNDQSAIREQLAVIKVLTDRGLVDGFGTQSHEFNINTLTAAQLKSSLDLMATGGVPIYVTELDISGNDQQQLERYQRLFPVYWEHPDVAGITLWGTVIGETWKDNTGLISRDGNTKRPAFNWLVEYMNSQPGVCNTGVPSVEITSPANNANFESGTEITLTADAIDTDGTISSVTFYDGTTVISTDNSSPYSATWNTAVLGSHTVKAIAIDNEGNESSDQITVMISVPQGPYNGVVHPIPGVIEAEEFDVGGNNSAYYDNTPGSEVSPVVNFRTDEDVDIEACTDQGGGYNIGYGIAGEWLEYSSNVVKTGLYDLDLRIACDGDGRTISIEANGVVVTADVVVPNTGGWQVWQTITVKDVELTEGEQIIRVVIGDVDYVNLNYIEFRALVTGVNDVSHSVAVYPNPFETSFTVSEGEKYSYSIVTVLGEEVEQGTNAQLALGENLEKGTYVLKLVDQKGSSFNQMIIKK